MIKISLTAFLLWITLNSTVCAQYEHYNFYLLNIHDTKSNTAPKTQFEMPHYFEEVSSQRLDPRYEKIVKELAYLQVFAVGSVGIIALLPESVSQWTAEDKAFVDAKELLTKHADNIDKGPVFDNDTWAINYIGHSVAGSYFYVWGRESGLSWQESAILTTLMSTFYWEYGWEAFAEVPSIQDLIITPVLGSLLGEGTHYLYTQIMQNNGEINDSKILGSMGRALLNPIGELNQIFDDAFDAANIEISIDYSYAQNPDNYRLKNIMENNGQIQSYFKLNFQLKY